MIGISGSLISLKTLTELIFNPCGDFSEVQRAQLSKSTLPTSMLVPLGSFKVCSDAEDREGCRKQWDAAAPIQSLGNCSLGS